MRAVDHGLNHDRAFFTDETLDLPDQPALRGFRAEREAGNSKNDDDHRGQGKSHVIGQCRPHARRSIPLPVRERQLEDGGPLFDRDANHKAKWSYLASSAPTFVDRLRFAGVRSRSTSWRRSSSCWRVAQSPASALVAIG